MICIRTALKLTILLALISNLALFAGTGLITTVAGTGAGGNAGIGGPATSAQLNTARGSLLRLRRQSLSSPIMSTIAWSGSMRSRASSRWSPEPEPPPPLAMAAPPHWPRSTARLGLTMDAAGNLYISEYRRQSRPQSGCANRHHHHRRRNGHHVSGGDCGPAVAAGVPRPAGSLSMPPATCTLPSTGTTSGAWMPLPASSQPCWPMGPAAPPTPVGWRSTTPATC